MTRRPIFILLALLSACTDDPSKSGGSGGADGDPDSIPDESVDADGDGHPAVDDCDDADPAVHPSATDDTVDGVDQDCDGFDGPDADGDGHAPESAGGDDCDDDDAATHPGADEVWGDGADQDCDGWADVSRAACEADLAFTLPDGTSVPFDGCGSWSLVPRLDFDPDTETTLRALELRLAASETDDCRVVITQQGLCGPGYYDLRDAASATTLVTWDCPGIPDAYEGELEPHTGYLHAATLSATFVDTAAEGAPLTAALSGGLRVTPTSGLSLHGTFSLGLTLPAADVDGSGWSCAVSDGDDDTDGYVRHDYDGPDCDDRDSRTYPGSVAEASADECMRDADRDGFGDKAAEAPFDAGTDCYDASARVYPGAVAEAAASECMWDSDGDGYGSATIGYPFDNGSDCDDARADVFPGSLGEAGPAECMKDADGDGFGDASARSPYDPGTDCDDADPLTFPGRAPLDSASACMRDRDADGWGDLNVAASSITAGSDCDDGAATTHPGAAALDSTATCLADLDGDGYGDLHAASPVGAGTDCDDTEAETHPGAAEAESSTACMADLDADGFGDEVAPTGGTAGTDCDDTSALASPVGSEGAVDGLDNDCNGVIDGVNDGSLHTARVLPEASGDQFGTGLAWTDDFDGDGVPDLLIGSRTANGIGDGKAYIVSGADLAAGGDWLATDADYSLENTADSYLGEGVAWLSDLDGDGRDEVLLHAQDAVYLVASSDLVAGTTTDLDYASSAPGIVFVKGTGTWSLGHDMVDLGDLDGDGLAELALSESSDSASIFLGSQLSSFSDYLYPERDEAVFIESQSAGSLGSAMAAGADFDGDGIDDFAIQSTTGLHLWSGPDLLGSSSLLVDDAGTILEVPADDGNDDCAWLEDVDGDGLADMLIGRGNGDANEDRAGEVYLVLGGTLSSGSTLGASDIEATWLGEDGQDYWGDITNDAAGSRVAALGDRDGDGLTDFAFVAPGYDSDTGKTYIVETATSGTFGGTTMADQVPLSLQDTRGATSGWMSETVVSSVDLDSDGMPELAIGPFNDTSAATWPVVAVFTDLLE